MTASLTENQSLAIVNHIPFPLLATRLPKDQLCRADPVGQTGNPELHSLGW